ncbi:MAG: glutamate--tRNA ligase [Leptospiraceae bacterium]
MSEVRTRFAPSPSGFLHIGGARTALFNYLYAKACGGSFVLRVEDTDQERSTRESEDIILDSLAWLGIEADEGVREGGSYGPYRQSDRLDRYSGYTDDLIQKGLAYPCFCTSEELEQKQSRSKMLGVPHVYDGKCSNLSPEEVQAKKDSGEPYAIRFKIDPSEVVVDDAVQGRVKFDARLIGDFIIVKSDGFPSYNYAVVIDDHEMKISHVIRGVGHLSNTPRQILIHRALGFDLPVYAHISEIVGTDRKKLSKRRGATSVLLFRDLGYLSEGLVNYMALLGWYPEDAVEFLPDGGLTQKFDIARCSKSPAMFDFFETDKSEAEFDPLSMDRSELNKWINQKSKLNWLNQKYIRHYELPELYRLARPFLEKNAEVSGLIKDDEELLVKALGSIREYMTTLDDAVPYILEIFRKSVEPENEEAAAVLAGDGASDVVEAFRAELEAGQPENPDDFGALMKAAGKTAGAKGRGLFMPIRVATTGKMHGLELPILFSLLGKETLLKRIESVMGSVK